MNVRSVLRALRFDGLWWRKFAYLGSVYGPEWWKRYSPPWIAAIIFLCVRRNRRGAIANMRRVLGAQGWWRDHWNGLKVFIGFAHCVNEALECLSPRPKPITIERPAHDPIEATIKEGRGVVIVTCHFGNWDVAARTLARYGRPFNLVMAREINATTAEYVRAAREAARRVEFFGAPALFQGGALRLARLAGTPVFPVFVARRGPRHYRIVIGTEHHVPRHASVDEMDRVLASIVAEFEDVVREYPDQWFQFAPFWPDDAAAGPTIAAAPRAGTTDRAAARAR